VTQGEDARTIFVKGEDNGHAGHDHDEDEDHQN